MMILLAFEDLGLGRPHFDVSILDLVLEPVIKKIWVKKRTKPDIENSG